MTDRAELKRLAEAFPADLDWDSNMEPFFNGPSGESLGGGPTGFYSVYGKPFRLEGEDYDYDGPTYVESCQVDFAKFMVAARDGVLALIAENERLERNRDMWKGQVERQSEQLTALRSEREPLVITLPNQYDPIYQEFFDDVDGGCFNYSKYLGDVRAVLAAAGLKVMP